MDTIGRFIKSEDILVDVEASNRDELLTTIGWHMENQHGLPHDLVTQGLMRRESLGSTALGQGVAIPHTRVKDVDHMVLAYLRMKTPIEFEAPDSMPVKDVLVLLAPKQADETHLTILAEAAQFFADPDFRDRLHRCQRSAEIKSLFETWQP
jgi:PTS system nitrogen regulatory IIA component